MKRTVFIVTLILMLGVLTSGHVHGQNGTNVLIRDGTLTAYFSPDAIGTYQLSYDADCFNTWPLTVTVYWQSDTYPGWHEFYSVTYPNANYAHDIVVLYSGTDDNVRYMVEYRTISYSTYMTWSFN